MTPHNEAKLGEIAKTVLMPGDPLRAKLIAENFLEDVKCFNSVRNMFGFTGKYNGKEVSVMGSGMGMPSMGIYSYELYKFYEVETIIRIGSAGSMNENVKLGDVVIALGACTDSNYVHQYKLPGNYSPIADFDLVEKARDVSKEMNINTKIGNILSSDVFYDDNRVQESWKELGVLAVEMETAALYMNSAKLNKKSVALLTISDSLITGESLSAQERLENFTDMIKISLRVACQ